LRTDRRWQVGWLPILANGGGDFYLVDLRPPVPGSIRHFRLEEQEHPVEFASLAAFFGTVAAAFERGVIYIDSNGYLEMNDMQFAELAGAMNPDVAWWRIADD